MKLEKRLHGLNSLNTRDENSSAANLKNRIEGFKKLEHNWDTYGAEKISLNSISNAIQVIKAFEINDLIIEHAFPMKDGGVQLEKDFENNSIEIELNPDNEITLLIFNKESNLILEKSYNVFEINDLINILWDYHGSIHHSGKKMSY